MRLVLIDYGSGNLHSAQKAFALMGRDAGVSSIEVTADPDAVLRAAPSVADAADWMVSTLAQHQVLRVPIPFRRVVAVKIGNSGAQAAVDQTSAPGTEAPHPAT